MSRMSSWTKEATKCEPSVLQHSTTVSLLQNLVRGRGLLCRSLMKSQMASPTFTPVYAALVAVSVPFTPAAWLALPS